MDGFAHKFTIADVRGVFISVSHQYISQSLFGFAALSFTPHGQARQRFHAVRSSKSQRGTTNPPDT
jgi:hypothetical protein